MDKDIGHQVGIVGDEVGGFRLKGHKEAAPGDGGVVGPFIPLPTSGSNGNTGRHAALPIADKNIAPPIGIARDKLIGPGLEGHKAAVGRDDRPTRPVICLPAIAVDRGPDGLARLPIVDKDILDLVVVVGHQVVGFGTKGHVAAVGRDGRGE